MQAGAQIDMACLFDGTFGGMVVLVGIVQLEGMGAVGSQGELHWEDGMGGENYSRVARDGPHGCGEDWECPYILRTRIWADCPSTISTVCAAGSLMVSTKSSCSHSVSLQI